MLPTDASAPRRRRTKTARRLLAATVLAGGLLAGSSAAANAAVTASFTPGAGQLTVIADNLNNNVTVSRDAAGKLLVNGGAVAVIGGTPTVANTALIQAFGLGGQDTITLSEANRLARGSAPFASLSVIVS